MVKNRITLNILADITRKLGGDNYSGNKEKALIVFTGSNIKLDGKTKELNKLKDHGIQISIAFSFMAERILDIDTLIASLEPVEVYKEEDVFNLEEISKNYSYIIGPNITMNTLSKVSLGMIDSFISNILWTYLYMGKKVYLDFTSVKNYLGVPSQNVEVNNMIDNHINTIKKMGAMEITEGNYMDRIINKKNTHIGEKTKAKKENTQSAQILNKVITENDILGFSLDNKSITLPKGTILTPLARDKARDMGIEIDIER